MPIYKGSTKQEKIYTGSTKIGKVYKGSTLVFQNVPRVFQQGGPAYTVNNLRVGSPLFSWFGTITAINGTIGRAGSSITFWRGSVDSATAPMTGAYQGTVTIDGFVFHVYDAYQLSYMTESIYVSPGQRVGDKVLEGYSNMTGGVGSNPYPMVSVASISGNSYTTNMGTGPFTITNTPVTNYIYRP